MVHDSNEFSMQETTGALASNLTDERVTTLLQYTDIEIATLPIVCILGLLGNVVSLVVFFSKDLRKVSCNVLLGVRAISDTVLLLTVLIFWLDKIGVTILYSSAGCRIIIYVSYVCGFLSVWLVVLVAVEYTIRLTPSTSVQMWCTVGRAKIAILALFVIATLFYSFALLFHDAGEFEGITYCYVQLDTIFIVSVFTYIDSAITLLVPFIIICSLLLITLCAFIKNRYTNAEYRRQRAIQRSILCLLLAVLITFSILNFPSHIVRLVLLIRALATNEDYISNTEYIVQNVTQYLYYVGFAINYVIYVIFGKSFRAKIKSQIMCKPFWSRGFQAVPAMDRQVPGRAAPHPPQIRGGNSLCVRNPHIEYETSTINSIL